MARRPEAASDSKRTSVAVSLELEKMHAVVVPAAARCAVNSRPTARA